MVLKIFRRLKLSYWILIFFVFWSFRAWNEVHYASRVVDNGKEKAVVLPLNMDTVPHVSKCNTCLECVLDDGSPLTMKGSEACSQSAFVQDVTVPEDKDFMGKEKAKDEEPRVCKICKGCKHTLEELNQEVSIFNSTYKHRTGYSSAWVYKIYPSCDPKGAANHTGIAGNSSQSGKKGAIVKVWCLPYVRFKYSNSLFLMLFRKLIFMKPVLEVKVEDKQTDLECYPQEATTGSRMDISMWRIAKECELDHLIPKVWTGPVAGLMPGTGYVVNKTGLFMEEAPGISIATLLQWGQDPDVMQEVMTKHINSTQVVDAAIFDLLTSQCDRHSNNIFLSGSGNIKLIDNGDALGLRNICREGVLLNSLFHPSSIEQTYALLGKKLAEHKSAALKLPYPLPHARMDYRCHHKKGKIGFDYPPGVKRCLKKFSLAGTQELTQELGLLNEDMTKVLQIRATDMLTKGFEWTLYHGQPQNNDDTKFSVQTPCCEMHKVPDSERPWWIPHLFKCEDGWKPNFRLFEPRPQAV